MNTMEKIPDEKDLKILRAVHSALVDNQATNQHAFDALSCTLVTVLRTFPLGMREAHMDMFCNHVMQAAFAEVMENENENRRPS